MDGRAFPWWAPRMLSVLRMVGAFLFMAHGAQKVFNYPSPPHPMSHPPPLMLVAGVLECFGGLLVFLGVFTRPVAFLLAGEMATAYFMAHAPLGFWPILNKGEPTPTRVPGERDFHYRPISCPNFCCNRTEEVPS